MATKIQLREYFSEFRSGGSGYPDWWPRSARKTFKGSFTRKKDGYISKSWCRELIRRYQENSDEDALSDLITAYYGFIYKFVKKHSHSFSIAGYDKIDLLSIGITAFAQTVEKFDLTETYSLTTPAATYIKNAILNLDIGSKYFKRRVHYFTDSATFPNKEGEERNLFDSMPTLNFDDLLNYLIKRNFLEKLIQDAKLTPEELYMLRQYYFAAENRSHKDIGRDLDLEQTVVNHRKHLALRKLRTTYQKRPHYYGSLHFD